MKKLFILILPFVFIIGCSTDTSTESASTQDSESDVTSSDQEKDADATSEETDTESDDAANNEADDADSSNVSSDSKNTESDNTEGSKEEYIHKLEEVEASLASLEEKDDSQLEMNEAEGEIFERWDDALNEVYGALESQLSNEAMETLREEQREWVKQRDNTAEEEASKYEGGSLETYEYVATQAQLTKERCYELVENYMNG